MSKLFRIKSICLSLLSITFFLGCDKETTKPNGQIIDTPIDGSVPIAERIKTSLHTDLVLNNDKNANGHTYNLHVYLPAAYVSDKNLPIIYLFNGGYNENSVLTPSSEVLLDKAIASIQTLNLDAIIVLCETDFRTNIDYDQFDDGENNFREFISTELFTFIEEKYPHNSGSRTMMGHGIGARYVLNSMFLEEQENNLFQRFIASDPAAILYLMGTIEKDEFPKEKPNLKLYFSISGTLEYEVIKPQINTFLGKQYPWLDTDYEEYLSFDHRTFIEPSFIAGLRFVFGIE